ncbi:MAG: hypothetical protein KU37_03630 [Sulfuricurvum sp. PC08-66]|nr:MAG: hypothetical protein KU37_03630 [Sulfuricurvum sp. PC08-66]
MKKSLFLTLGAIASTVMAQEAFSLGEITVTGTQTYTQPFTDTIDADAIALRSTPTLAEALEKASGVTFYRQGGRAESNIFIRGFDSRRIGVFIDGVPVYVPYDGNIDYSRFLTANVATIDIAKGFSPTAFGANTMGGVINVVSKKPTKALEANAYAQTNLDSAGALASYAYGASIGSRLPNNLYTQMAFNVIMRDHFRLPDSFEPIYYSGKTTQEKGNRVNSDTQDMQANFKVGYLMDEGEVALGYHYQTAQKSQPPIVDYLGGQLKFWDWPQWDKQSLFVAGEHALLGGKLKATLYWDSFDNKLNGYKDANLSIIGSNGDGKTTAKSSMQFKSNYQESTYGARAHYTVGWGASTTTLSANYKTDSHKGYDLNITTDVASLSDAFEDTTLSIGVDEEYRFGNHFALLAGASYDARLAGKVVYANASMSATPAPASALNPQAALVANLAEAHTLRISSAQKSYFPSMKDRYSYRLGMGLPNPALLPEKTTHNELSYHGKLFEGFSLNGALFYSVVENAIESVEINSTVKQNQNIGTFVHAGAELEAAWEWEMLRTGANFSTVTITSNDINAHQIGIPTQSADIYAQVTWGNVAVVGSAYGQMGHYGQLADSSYVRLSGFVVADAKVVYTPLEALTVEAGIKNLTDALYYYDDSYPEAGREYFARLGYVY